MRYDGLGTDARIRDVWADNLLDELDTISALIDTYNYIAMVSGILPSAYWLSLYCSAAAL
jgi:hypothetical protein